MLNHQKKILFLHQMSQILNEDSVKSREPLILRMYASLNLLELENENRYLLCNFLDQNSDIMKDEYDIYNFNNDKTINQLFLLAFHKAKKHELLDVLFEEYLSTILNILKKKEIIV